MEQVTTISIYVIQNINTLTVYVGQTKRPSKRWSNHRYFARHLGKKTRHVHRCMNAEGVENFRFTVIETHTTQQDADIAESFWIEFFRANGGVYNIVDGGVNMQNLYRGKHFSPSSEFKPGHVMSEETRAKISATAKAKCIRPPSRLGAKCSDETRARMAMSNARFAPEDIACIREEAQRGTKIVALAKRYSASTCAISNIVAGKTYRHVPSVTASALH